MHSKISMNMIMIISIVPYMYSGIVDQCLVSICRVKVLNSVFFLCANVTFRQRFSEMEHCRWPHLNSLSSIVTLSVSISEIFIDS